MTDSQFIQKELRNEIFSQKSIARSASKKICGSKSKRRAMLPSDYLTQKQIKERNGPVMSLNLSAPIHYKEFRKLPSDLQKTYITNLIDKYDVSIARLKEAFGSSYNVTYNIVKDLELQDRFTKGRKQTPLQHDAYEVFLRGSTTTPDAFDDVQGACETQTADTYAEDQQIETKMSVSVDDSEHMSMQSAQIEFCGKYDEVQVMNTLRYIVGCHENVCLTISIHTM